MPEHTLRHTLSEVESELAGAKSSLAKAIGAHEIEVRALKARIAVLERALEPFSALGEVSHSGAKKPESEVWGWNGKTLTVGDFARARDATANKSPRPTLVGNWTEKL